MSSDKIVIYMNDKRFDGAFEHFVNKVYEAGAASAQKELEATRAELAAEREKCMLIAQDLKWENQLSLKLQESKAELESTRAELAAERAKPRGGVAWVLRKKATHELDEYLNGSPAIHPSQRDAEEHRLMLTDTSGDWEVVPYPIGDGADVLKAAIEAKEKAEAEVAAWKEAANSTNSLAIYTPFGLAQVLNALVANADTAKAELAALKAAPAEVPPLDKWRVLATVAEMAYKAADFDFAKAVCLQVSVAEWKESKPYPLKD
jgi:hypothetical protein